MSENYLFPVLIRLQKIKILMHKSHKNASSSSLYQKFKSLQVIIIIQNVKSPYQNYIDEHP